ncbi:phage tail protein [Paenibacillus chitinolyticus]|uniref:Phage tail protein n=1 Tax=Paenibacillus chitinolyticus TaxID=79263 RepID=A0ABT4FMG0_9BACL|nr:phage tail protein [Paenibacillus chitinolyticus]MCY9593714.1 phage tail protein [Paenibacillus chitinolyticus]MCY9599720.1 phage tail protein [Paenibacillus chitinolyticus]
MLKVFDQNLTPVGVLPDASDVERKRRLNSDYELSFLLPMTSPNYREKVRHKGHVQDERGQYYVINDRKRVRDGRKLTALIECSHIMFKLSDFKMPYTGYIEEAFGTNILTLTNAITAATGGKFLFSIDDQFDKKDIKDFGRGNALQALNQVVKTFEAEVEPNNFTIHLKKKIGTDTGMQYRFKKNIVSNTFKDSTRALVTRLYAQMKDGLSFIGLSASELTTEEYNLLNTIPGAIVDGKIRVNYLISPYAGYWSNTTNTYYDGELINQDIEDPKELLEATRKALKEQEVPSVEVSIEAADLFKLDNSEPRPNMGDPVYLIDPEMELNNITARVVEITEYPYARDKHTQVTLANYLLRDYADIIADLDRAKQIVNDITSGAKLRTTVFEAFAKQAIYDINSSKTEVKYDQRGIILEDKSNAKNQVVMSSNGVYLTTDGGVTPRAAITANGVVAEVIVGVLGQFVQLKANQIVVGSQGEKIEDGLIKSAGEWNNKVGQNTPYNGVIINTTDGVSVIRSDNKTRVIMNATEGFKIQGNDGGGWKDKLFADLNGKLTAEDLVANRFIMKNGGDVLIDGNTRTIDFSKFTTKLGTISTANIETLIVGQNVIMGPNAYISWNQVAGRPNTTYIDANGIYTGKVTANQIDTNGLSAQRIFQAGSPQNYAQIGGSYGDFVMYYNNSELFRFYNGLGNIQFQFLGSSLLSFGRDAYGRDSANPLKIWDFSLATVRGISVNAVEGLEARLRFLEDRAFIGTRREGGNLVFSSKNYSNVDYGNVVG